MKNLKTLFCMVMAAFLAVSCSDNILPEPEDPNTTNGSEGDGDGFYMALDIQMPTGDFSRSETTTGGGSTGGVEVGSDAENQVSSALIVLARRSSDATRNFGFIAAGEVNANRLTATNTPSKTPEYRALARIYKTNLNQYYTELTNTTVNPRVYVFVFCNPTKELIDRFRNNHTAYGSTSWVNAVGEVLQGQQEASDYNLGIWGGGSFLMNNVSLTTRALPKTIVEWELFNKVENPFHLSDDNTATGYELPNNSSDNTEGGGAVKVERSVARFDFKDGSPIAGTKDIDGNVYPTATYHVYYHDHEGQQMDGSDGGTPEPIINVQLINMSLVNMAKKFYYLPRVSRNGLLGATMGDEDNTDNKYTLCGAEMPWMRDETTGQYTSGNYVVGPNAAVYNDGGLETGFDEYFNYSFFENNGTYNTTYEAAHRWDVYPVSQVLGGTINDNYNGKSDYKVWRYVTENVIPGVEEQVNGISTGVVFKARMLGDAYGLTIGNSSHDANWEKDIYTQLVNCLNGKPWTNTDGSTHPAIKGNPTDDPILYYFDNKIFLDWPHFRQAAIQASVSFNAQGQVEINRSNPLYRAVFGEGGIPLNNVYMTGNDPSKPNQYEKINDPEWANREEAYKKSADAAWNAWSEAGRPSSSIDQNTNTLLANLRAAVTAADVTMYQSVVDLDTKVAGYYCYYYYWNRHNDNNIAGVMGPMEFAVVRNNVYKLSVDKISRLGHPRVPENDPNNPDPNTPDEASEIYLDVTVEIADWAVRVNSIQF